MITAGVDCGSKNIKIIILKDKKIAGQSLMLAGIDTGSTAKEA